MRSPFAKVRHKPLLAIRFGAKLEDLLLPQEVHRERSGDEVREVFSRSALEIFGIVVKNKCMAGFEELHELSLHAGTRGEFPVFEIVHLALEQRTFWKEFDDSERRAAHRPDVHSAVVVTLGDVQDLR